MLARYSIGGTVMTDADDAFQMALSHAHGKRERPLCLCRDQPIPMYIARIDGRFYVKRMPNSGETHDPMCASYEMPPELSGLGPLQGSAITEDSESGRITLKVAFSLTRRPNRGAIAQSGTVSDTVKSDAHKLSIRSTLHYLLHQAGFNRWSPRMEGKRSWGVIRRHILAAAENKKVKGQPLGDLLYIPEPWTKDHEHEIRARRQQHTAKIVPTTGGTHALMVYVGECKSVDQTALGYKMVVKNAPDFPLVFSKDVRERIVKRFGMEFGLKESLDSSHLMFVATFSLGVARDAQLDEVSFMICTKEWLPVEMVDEVDLLTALVAQRRHFIKGLRYNMACDAPMASAVLLDSTAKETALYVVPAAASEAYRVGIEELQEGSSLPSWTWNVGTDAQVPALPPTAPLGQRSVGSTRASLTGASSPSTPRRPNNGRGDSTSAAVPSTAAGPGRVGDPS